MSEETAIVEATEETNSAVPADTAPIVAPVNIPLTDGQKLILRTYQNRLTTLAKQKSEIDVQVARIEGAMQVDMMKIARENNIDPTKFGFSDNLDIIPAGPQSQGSPRRS